MVVCREKRCGVGLDALGRNVYIEDIDKEIQMLIANQPHIEKITNVAIYGDAANVNAALVAKTGGKVPCYAINGKRARVKWVSVGSSAVIGRGEAAKWLARFGADINELEAA